VDTKKVRKAEEDQYDFSSADIGKMQTGTTQKKSKGSKSRTHPSIPEVPSSAAAASQPRPLQLLLLECIHLLSHDGN